jgi:transposase
MKKSDFTAASTAENNTEIAELKARISELETLVKYYEEQFRISKHRQFGASSEKSEYDFNQLSIFNEAEHFADANVPEPELVEVQKHYRKRTRLTTDKLPEDLPVEIVEYDLPESEQICPECGGPLHVMGRETRRELVIIPAQVKIREHVRKIYACRDCEKDECGVPVLKSKTDEPVIKGSFASPETIAHLMTQKFVMGSPLYRQEKELKQRGIMLSRQTMSNWLLRATEDWLEPIYDVLHEVLCTAAMSYAENGIVTGCSGLNANLRPSS